MSKSYLKTLLELLIVYWVNQCHKLIAIIYFDQTDAITRTIFYEKKKKMFHA